MNSVTVGISRNISGLSNRIIARRSGTSLSSRLSLHQSSCRRRSTKSKSAARVSIKDVGVAPLGVPELQLSQDDKIKWSFPTKLNSILGGRDSEDQGDPTDLLVSKTFRFHVGDYIEVGLEDGQSFDGVIIRLLNDGNMYVIVSNGEVIQVTNNDVRYCMPAVVDSAIAARGWTDSVDKDVIRACTSARADMVKAMQPFLKSVHNAVIQVKQAAAGTLYTKFRDPDGRAWKEMILEDAYDHISSLLPQAKSPRTLAIRRLAVHKYLVENADEFMGDSSRWDFFYVVPYSHLQLHREVVHWVRAKDPRVTNFTNKAKSILEFQQKLEEESKNERDVSFLQNPQHTFDHDDLKLVTFLQHYLYRLRHSQHNPYAYPVTCIVRGLSLGENTHRNIVAILLRNLGFSPSWGDVYDGDVRLQLRYDKSREVELEKQAKQIRGEWSKFYNGSNSGIPRFGDGVDDIRHDWGQMPVYIIDSASAKELDDGVSIEKAMDGSDCHWVHVHVADPTAYIRPNDALGLAARLRMNTVYTPAQTLSMLPSSVSQRQMSLGGAPQGQPQPVFTSSYKVNGSGRILDQVMRPGFIRNPRVLHYDDVDDAFGIPRPEPVVFSNFPHERRPLEGASTVSPIDIEDLRTLRQVSQALFRKRVQEGLSIPLSTNDIEVVSTSTCPPFQSSTHSSVMHCRGRPSFEVRVMPAANPLLQNSRQTVAELMVAAARTAGDFARKQPGHALFMYRQDWKTGIEHMDGYMDRRNPETGELPREYWRATRVGIYGTSVPEDTDPYIRFTSPLRRYPDMYNHWLFKAALNPSAPTPGISGHSLEKLVQEADWFARAAAQKEKAMKNFVASTVLKRVLEQKTNPQRSYLDNLEAIVNGDKHFNPMTAAWTVRVQVPRLGLSGSLKEMTRERATEIAARSSCFVRLSDVRDGPDPSFIFSLLEDF